MYLVKGLVIFHKSFLIIEYFPICIQSLIFYLLATSILIDLNINSKISRPHLWVLCHVDSSSRIAEVSLLNEPRRSHGYVANVPKPLTSVASYFNGLNKTSSKGIKNKLKANF